MSKTQDEVTRLLKRGLNHYGLGDLDAAIGCWEDARAVDPDNQAVYDYLETAYEEAGVDRPSELSRPETRTPRPDEDDDDATPRSVTPPSLPLVTSDDVDTERGGISPGPDTGTNEDVDSTIAGALSAYKNGRLDEAWVKLQAAAKSYPDRLDVQGYLQLVRSEQAQRWAKEIGDQGRVLTLKAATADLMNLDLHPEEGFLLSQIDNMLTITDLMSLSNCGRVRSLEIIAKLLREGIIE